MAGEHVGERRHAEARQLIGSTRRNRSLQRRRALQRPIVVHDDDAVAREMHVELGTVGAEGEPVVEGLVFSGASALSPRCAKTSGRDDSKKRSIQDPDARRAA